MNKVSFFPLALVAPFDPMVPRREVLKLYRDILTLHKRYLPEAKRLLGDAYLRDEFRRHAEAKSEFMTSFFREWNGYKEILERKGQEV